MRQIKFRAWDERRKKMWSADEMGQDQLTLSPDGRGFINVNGTSTRLSTYLPFLIPLQYTGLLDKGGKEIYEGDLVRFKGLEKIVYIGEVYWNDKKLHYSVQGELCHCALKIDEKYKVIGNIYENPELLNGLSTGQGGPL